VKTKLVFLKNISGCKKAGSQIKLCSGTNKT
jgi:hypothetical protein